MKYLIHTLLGLLVVMVIGFLVYYRIHTPLLPVSTTSILPPQNPEKMQYLESPAPLCGPTCKWRYTDDALHTWTLVKDFQDPEFHKQLIRIVVMRVYDARSYEGYYIVGDGFRQTYAQPANLESGKRIAELYGKTLRLPGTSEKDSLAPVVAQ